MFIICEYAACVLAVLTGATLLFTACVMFLVLEEGGSILAQTSRKLTRSAIPLKGRWMAAEVSRLLATLPVFKGVGVVAIGLPSEVLVERSTEPFKEGKEMSSD